MEEIEARKTQKLADFYSELLEIEEAFDSAKIEIETKFSIANNFDLENPETYVKLIRPVSRKIQHIGNTCKLATYKLKEYQQIAASTSNSSIKSPQIAASTSNSSTDSQNLTPTPTQTQYPLTLEPRLSRLEFLVYLLYCLLLAAVLGIVIPMLFISNNF